jgi:alkanesulfonate monooxygenase SsuD/methylene tetrahydromethanopterin reductase-like flavin-dependent oxidoreductase (luciferase family)
VTLSIGLAGALDHGVLRVLAPRIEALGFAGLWLNDTPGGDAIAGLAVAAQVTTTLRLGCGVIPVDRRPAPGILHDLAAYALPAWRLTVGIGSGGPRDAIRRVGDALDELRAGTTADVLVGALGPRMRRLAAERADGVLLNWLDPASAADAAAQLRQDAPGAAGRAVLYVRTALEADASPALAAETARYAGYPVYAANLERLGITARAATIDGTAELAERLPAYAAAVDEVVLRVITAHDSLAELERVLERAAPAI